MTKNLRKAIMKRSHLKTKYFKISTACKICDYTRNKTIFVSRIRKNERRTTAA